MVRLITALVVLSLVVCLFSFVPVAYADNGPCYEHCWKFPNDDRFWNCIYDADTWDTTCGCYTGYYPNYANGTCSPMAM